MKQRGVLRYTDKATGRPVMDVPKEMIAAWAGKTSSRTARRSVARWNQGAMNQGKGDMPRPQTPVQKMSADDAWDRAFCKKALVHCSPCTCFECRHNVG